MTPASAPAPATRAPSVTPMMAQFLEIKEAHKDYLLFYRMGDFYELFFDDAVVAARALDITLTKRGKHLGQDIPMCGVPIHAAEAYLEQLIKRGHKVAVCEQTEDPAEAKKRGSKSVVRREVVRLVTAGTLTEDSLLDPQASNYLAALHWPAGREAALALAWTDISTGAVAVLGTKASQWIGDMQRLRPREVLVPAGRLSEIAGHDQVSEAGIVLTPLAESQYHGGRGARRLCEIYGVAQLDGLGDYSAAEVSALAALLDYVALTQKGALPTLRPPVRERSEDLLAIDAGTRSNLELLETQTRERKGSLLWAIDCTVSKPGSRLLGAWLASPLANKARIEERLAATRYFFFEADLRKTIRLRLTGLPDLARSLSRLTLNRGGPRDLGLVADAVIAAQDAARALIAGAAESRQALPERLGALIRHLT
ncbi:MAG: DNA mismatch repair protein MutS, partial [Pseudomonadota bacterium]